MSAPVNAAERAAALAARVGDDGTGDLRVIVDAAIAQGDSLSLDDLAEVVRDARAEARAAKGGAL